MRLMPSAAPSLALWSSGVWFSGVCVCGLACTGTIGGVDTEGFGGSNAGGPVQVEQGAGRGGAPAIREFPDSGQPGGGGPAVADSGALGEPEPTPRPPHEYCDAPTLVLAVSCGNGSCHSNPGFVNGDFASSPERARAYVDRVSARGPSCGLVINSENPARSLLLTKIEGTYPSNCGGAMPVGSFGDFPPDQLECLKDWVRQFAH